MANFFVVYGSGGFVTTKNRPPGKSREKFTFREHSEVSIVQDITGCYRT
jgi:hypothetical protein